MSGKKRGLGRGLDVLLAGAKLESAPERMKQVAVERLSPGSFQPRKDIDPGKLQELADSISARSGAASRRPRGGRLRPIRDHRG